MFTEKCDFKGGEFTKNRCRGGRDCLKRGIWTVSRFKRGRACQERGGGVFEGGGGEGVDTPMHTRSLKWQFLTETEKAGVKQK